MKNEEEEDLTKKTPDNSDDSDESVIIIENEPPEIITINSQSWTQEFGDFMSDVETESKKIPEAKNIQKATKIIREFSCDVCDAYHITLGRDLATYTGKYGVCSKHWRSDKRPIDTPYGFWNPKIADTDEENI